MDNRVEYLKIRNNYIQSMLFKSVFKLPVDFFYKFYVDIEFPKFGSTFKIPVMTPFNEFETDSEGNILYKEMDRNLISFPVFNQYFSLSINAGYIKEVFEYLDSYFEMSILEDKDKQIIKAI